MGTEFSTALRHLLAKKGHGAQLALANQLRLTPQYISRLSRAERVGSEDIRRNIASVLGYSYEDFLELGRALLRGETPSEREAGFERVVDRLNVDVLLYGEWKEKPSVATEDYYAAPLIDGKIAAGFGREIGEGDFRSLVWIYAPALRDRRHHDLIAVEVDPINGDSMTPSIMPGDIVLIDRDDPKGDPMSFHSGRIYAVRMGGGEGCAVKRVFAGKRGFVIASDNQAKYPPEISWTDDLNDLVIGRVVWGWRNLLEA
jgi:phage repressor protein C with HTH and peptisase S24 domain